MRKANIPDLPKLENGLPDLTNKEIELRGMSRQEAKWLACLSARSESLNAGRADWHSPEW